MKPCSTGSIITSIFSMIYHLYVDSKKAELIETESRMVDARGSEKWGDISQRIETSSYKMDTSGHLIFSMGNMVNNTVLYT